MTPTTCLCNHSPGCRDRRQERQSLLSLSRAAGGTILAEVRLMPHFGVWLKVNGDAIYATCPSRICKDGSTRVAAYLLPIGHCSSNPLGYCFCWTRAIRQ